MAHHNSCLVCGSEKTGKYLLCTDHFVTGEKFTLARCEQCGFLFTQDHPDEKNIASYYDSEEYISHSDTTKTLTGKIYHLARSFMLKRKVKLVKKATGLNSGRLLDIGSGTGYFAGAMARAGWTAEGVEINPAARDYSRRKFGITVFTPEEKPEKENYDCITLWHVLEHFNDPGRLMSEIHRMLKPGGRCIVALPNSLSFDAAHYGEFWAAWDVPRHLWHFNTGTFRKYCEKSMFELINVNILPLDVFYISALSEKYKGSNLSLVRGFVKGKWFFLKTIFRKERASSLIFILKKQD